MEDTDSLITEPNTPPIFRKDTRVRDPTIHSSMQRTEKEGKDIDTHINNCLSLKESLKHVQQATFVEADRPLGEKNGLERV